ncbi:hypothetical protein BC832DRAFT_612825 [Gaertneriomyces semiglobifer]|nr:hypothetical protein BC832DRAFT_612825 [Gaertneriomyces semiglobifer]
MDIVAPPYAPPQAAYNDGQDLDPYMAGFQAGAALARSKPASVNTISAHAPLMHTQQLSTPAVDPANAVEMAAQAAALAAANIIRRQYYGHPGSAGQQASWPAHPMPPTPDILRPTVPGQLMGYGFYPPAPPTTAPIADTNPFVVTSASQNHLTPSLDDGSSAYFPGLMGSSPESGLENSFSYLDTLNLDADLSLLADQILDTSACGVSEDSGSEGYHTLSSISLANVSATSDVCEHAPKEARPSKSKRKADDAAIVPLGTAAAAEGADMPSQPKKKRAGRKPRAVDGRDDKPRRKGRPPKAKATVHCAVDEEQDTSMQASNAPPTSLASPEGLGVQLLADAAATASESSIPPSSSIALTSSVPLEPSIPDVFPTTSLASPTASLLPTTEGGLTLLETGSLSSSDATDMVKGESNSSGGGAIKHQRKVAHNAIERRYRNNINDRITELRLVVPALNGPKIRDAKGSKRHLPNPDTDTSDSDGDELIDGVSVAKKLNKATILRKSTEYILYLKNRCAKLEDDKRRLSALVESLGGADLLRKVSKDGSTGAHLINQQRSGMNSEQLYRDEKSAQRVPHPSSPSSQSSSSSSAPLSPSSTSSTATLSPSPANNGGIRMMAMMLLSVCVLYAPSPFEQLDAVHRHVQGKILGTQGPQLASVDSAPGAWHLALIALWSIMKFILPVLSAVTLLFSTPKKANVTAKAATASALASQRVQQTWQSLESQLRSLTGRRIKPTVWGCARELFAYMRFCALGRVAGHDDENGIYAAAVAKVAGALLEADANGKNRTTSASYKIYLSLHTLNYACRASPGRLPPATRSRILLVAALELKLVAQSMDSRLWAALWARFADSFWRQGTDLANSDCACQEESEVGWVTRWDEVGVECFIRDGLWCRDMRGASSEGTPRKASVELDYDEPERLIPIPSTPLSHIAHLHRLHILRSILSSASGAAYLCAPTFAPMHVDRPEMEEIAARLRHVLHDSSKSRDALGGYFAGLSVAMARWKMRRDQDGIKALRAAEQVLQNTQWDARVHKAAGQGAHLAQEVDLFRMRKVTAVGLFCYGSRRCELSHSVVARGESVFAGVVGLVSGRQNAVGRDGDVLRDVATLLEFLCLTWGLEACLEGIDDVGRTMESLMTSESAEMEKLTQAAESHEDEGSTDESESDTDSFEDDSENETVSVNVSSAHAVRYAHATENSMSRCQRRAETLRTAMKKSYARMHAIASEMRGLDGVKIYVDIVNGINSIVTEASNMDS